MSAEGHQKTPEALEKALDRKLTDHLTRKMAQMWPRAGMITFTDAALAQLVAARVAEILTAEKVEQMAQARIDERIGRLSIEEACQKLGAKNERSLRQMCAKYGIPITKWGNKIEWILVADIEEADRKYRLHLPYLKQRAA